MSLINTFYSILQVFFRRYWRIFPLTVGHPERVPLDGPLILAANHRSNWDPPFLGTYIDRPVSYMAKQELFEIPIFGKVIPHLYAFPIRRGAADRTAIKQALAVLKENRCVGVFPEGTRHTDGKLGRGGAGVSLLAAMSKAPVVPTALIGTNEIFGKQFLPPLAVLYGEPLYFTAAKSDKAALTEFSALIMEKIAAMIDAYQQGEII